MPVNQGFFEIINHFDIKPGDRLMVLGDEDPERAGIAIVKEDVFMELAAQIMDAVKRGEE